MFISWMFDSRTISKGITLNTIYLSNASAKTEREIGTWMQRMN